MTSEMQAPYLLVRNRVNRRTFAAVFTGKHWIDAHENSYRGG